MIVGLGTDIVEICRIDDSLSRLGEKFAKRILTKTELELMAATQHKSAYLAKRFAAKEAAVKALGVGIGRGLSWQHFEVSNDDLGAPKLLITGYARELCDKLGVKFAHLTISDERHYATATVILES